MCRSYLTSHSIFLKGPVAPTGQVFFLFWAQIGHSTHQKFPTWSAHYFETCCLKPQQILNQHFLFSSSFLQMQFAKKLFQEWICLFNKEKKNTCTHSIYEGSCCCIVYIERRNRNIHTWKYKKCKYWIASIANALYGKAE